MPLRIAIAFVLAIGFLGFSLPGCGQNLPDISSMDPDSAFVVGVIPVLKDQCEDCHFPGGPMYKEMPFDDLTTVRSLEDELLTRLSGKGRKQVEGWLERLRAGELAPNSSTEK